MVSATTAAVESRFMRLKTYEGGGATATKRRSVLDLATSLINTGKGADLEALTRFDAYGDVVSERQVRNAGIAQRRSDQLAAKKTASDMLNDFFSNSVACCRTAAARSQAAVDGGRALAFSEWGAKRKPPAVAAGTRDRGASEAGADPAEEAEEADEEAEEAAVAAPPPQPRLAPSLEAAQVHVQTTAALLDKVLATAQGTQATLARQELAAAALKEEVEKSIGPAKTAALKRLTTKEATAADTANKLAGQLERVRNAGEAADAAERAIPVMRRRLEQAQRVADRASALAAPAPTCGQCRTKLLRGAAQTRLCSLSACCAACCISLRAARGAESGCDMAKHSQ